MEETKTRRLTQVQILKNGEWVNAGEPMLNSFLAGREGGLLEARGHKVRFVRVDEVL